MLRLHAIPPPHENYGADEMKGANGHGVNYSVADMYGIISGFKHMQGNAPWNRIWNLHVTERVKSFIWLALHDRLITNHKKNRMGLGHAMCNYCGDISETELHVLRDCPLVMPLWLNVVDQSMRSDFSLGDIQQWISLNLCSSANGKEDIMWRNFWATSCHVIWMWRNMAEHDDHFQRPSTLELIIAKQINQYQQKVMMNTVSNKVARTEVMIYWKTPLEGWVKLNTDGAYKEGSVAGYVAELWGVLEGLRYARKLGFTRIELNVDSSVVDSVLRLEGKGSPLDVLANIGCTIDSDITYYEACPSECHLV
ncbi:hypothetical protein L195_g043024, partial [Trifolium pratense]